jgi:hypothetical protein
MVSGKVIERHQSSTSEQLWASRGKPPGLEAHRLISLLNSYTQPQ